MNSEEFRDLLNRFEAGKCTHEEEQLIASWYKSVGKGVNDPRLSDPGSKAAIERKLWAGIKSGIEASKINRHPSITEGSERKAPFRWSYKVAASVAIGLLSTTAILFYFNQKAENEQQSEVAATLPETVTLMNSFAEPLSALLSDGSEVILYPGSEITYPERFDNQKREITLTGEAFFDVAKDASRPFFVYTQEVVTKVLGTSFTIKAYTGGKEITVAVKTGKVSVSASPSSQRDNGAPPSQEIILNPNQLAVYSKLEERVEKKEITNPASALTKPVSYHMQFEEAPVSRILQMLDAMYGVKIVFREQDLSGCNLTTSMTDETLEERIKIICTAIGADYEFSPGAVTISGYGCK